MRSLFVIFFFSLCSFFSFAQTSEVKKLIKKYDAKYLMNIPGEKHPGNFWYTVVSNNKRISAIQEAQKNKNKSLQDAYTTLSYVMANTPQNDYIAYGYDSLKNVLISKLGIENLAKEHPLIIIADGDINASMDVIGQMRIFRGCIDFLTEGELIAVCAHEVAHFACSHVVSRMWKSAKKARANKMWADIGVSIFMGAMVAAAGSNAYYGLDNSYIEQITSNADLFYYRAYDYANDATAKYTYRYNREEESEADILAYRFMEYMGYGGENVISMLKKMLARYGDTPKDRYKSHPSTSFRIQVLESMKNGFTGKNKSK